MRVVSLKPSVDDSVVSVCWHIGDREVVTDEYPYSVPWRLETGRHSLRFIALRNTGEEVESEVVEVLVVD